MVFLCKFGQNPPIGSGDRVQTRLIFTVFIKWLPWKISQGHQNLRIFKPFHHYNIWSLARIRYLVQEIGCRKLFGQNLKILVFIVWSRSSKSNQIFKPSQRYNLWSLARICHLVQEIGCKQAFLGQNLKILNCWCDLENEVKFTKIKSLLSSSQ